MGTSVSPRLSLVHLQQRRPSLSHASSHSQPSTPVVNRSTSASRTPAPRCPPELPTWTPLGRTTNGDSEHDSDEDAMEEDEDVLPSTSGQIGAGMAGARPRSAGKHNMNGRVRRASTAGPRSYASYTRLSDRNGFPTHVSPDAQAAPRAGNASSRASEVTVPPASSHISSVVPSSSPDTDASRVPAKTPSGKLRNGAATAPHSLSRPTKRRRESNASQSRETQERVEQKRVRTTLAKTTSLADLYAQLRRDSDASETAPSRVTPRRAGPGSVSASASAQAGSARPNDALRAQDRVAESPDPMEVHDPEDQEIVLVKHVPAPPRSPLKPIERLARPSVSPTKPGPSTPTPKAKVALKPRKSKGWAVVIISPPKRTPLKPSALAPRTSSEAGSKKAGRAGATSPEPDTLDDLEDTPVAGSSKLFAQRRPPSRAGAAKANRAAVPSEPGSLDGAVATDPLVAALTATFAENAVGGGKRTPTPLRPHRPASTPTPVPAPAHAPLVPAAESATPEPALRRSRRAMGLTEDVVLSPREIDALLEATPITLDLSLTHYHPPAPASSTNTDTTDAILPADAAATAPPTAPEAESKQLWWHHPAFEARAKADIRRTLRLLLPPSDPDLASAPARAEVRRRQSSARMWATRLEDAFGPGPLDRGTGRKPRRLAGPKHAAGAREGRARWGGGAVVMPPRRAWPALAPPSRQPTPDHGDAGEVAAAALPPAEMNVDIDLDAVVPSADGTQHTAVPDAGAAPAPAPAAEPEGYVTLTEAAAWTAALLPLAKGKALPDAAMLARAHDALSAADHARRISTRVLKESGLADAVKRVGEEKGGPLRNRARQLAEWWRANFGDAALGLAEP